VSEQVRAPFAPLQDALPRETSGAPETIGRARVTTWNSDAIALEMSRPIALGFALAALSLVTVGGAHFLRANDETRLLAHGLTLVSIPIVLVAFRALFSTPRCVLTRSEVRVDVITSPLARSQTMPFTDLADVRVRLFFERYKDVMRVVSARLLVVAHGGRTLEGPTTETLPVDEWRTARDAILPLARELSRRARVPLVIDHAGPLPPILRDAESPLAAPDEKARDRDDDNDDDDDA